MISSVTWRPFKRQFHHADVVDHLTDPGAARLHQRRVCLNFDCFGNLTDFKRDVDYRIRADLQHDSGLRKCAESRKDRFQLVRSDRKVRQRVRAGFIRHHATGECP